MEEIRWWFPAGSVVTEDRITYRWERTRPDPDSDATLLDSGPLEIVEDIGYLRPCDRTVPVEEGLMDEWLDTLPTFRQVHRFFDGDLAEGDVEDPWFCNCARWESDLDALMRACRNPSGAADLIIEPSRKPYCADELWAALGLAWIPKEIAQFPDSSSLDREDSFDGRVVTLTRTLGAGLEARAVLDVHGRTQTIRSIVPFWCPTSMGRQPVRRVLGECLPPGPQAPVWLKLNDLQFLFVGPTEDALGEPDWPGPVKVGGILLTAEPSERDAFDLFGLVNRDQREPLGRYHFVGLVCQISVVSGTNCWWYALDLLMDAEFLPPIRCLLSSRGWRQPLPPLVGNRIEGQVQFLGTVDHV